MRSRCWWRGEGEGEGVVWGTASAPSESVLDGRRRRLGARQNGSENKIFGGERNSASEHVSRSAGSVSVSGTVVKRSRALLQKMPAAKEKA